MRHQTHRRPVVEPYSPINPPRRQQRKARAQSVLVLAAIALGLYVAYVNLDGWRRGNKAIVDVANRVGRAITSGQ